MEVAFGIIVFKNIRKYLRDKYAIEIFYSEDDEGCIAVVPELAGYSAFGETEEAALKEVMIAMELWLETAEKEGREIPRPAGKELLKAVADKK